MSAPRPLFHYSPPSGWVNDPLALTFHAGRYHLFFQYLPDRTTWDLACQWGHATSDDLLTWHTEPVALAPGDGEDGVWSGCLVNGPGQATVLYTAVDATDADRGRVRRALPVDETWTGWRKDEVVLTTPPEADVRAFRDPYVSSYDGGWRMLLAGGLADGSGALWVSYSQDLLDWTPPALAASGTEVGPLWECPSLLVVGGRQVLVVSVGGPSEQHAVAYAWCEVQGDRFVLGPWQVLTYGPSLYAASGFTEDSGEAGLIAWLRGVGDVEAGWMGAHSLPYRLSAVGERLVARPHPVLDGYRQGGVLRELLPACADLDWSPLPGDVLDASGLFRLEAVGGAVTIGLAGGSYELPWDGGPLRVVLDGPVLEVFGDGGVLAAPVPATGRDGVLTGSVERVVVHRLVGG